MLTKCCSPSCPAVFRYLHEGRVFILENDHIFSSVSVKKPEYFWLCHRCSSTLTLGLGEEGRVSLKSLPAEFHDGSRGDFYLHDRKAGLMLKSIAFPEYSEAHRARRALQPGRFTKTDGGVGTTHRR